jgi:hypothetical protein
MAPSEALTSVSSDKDHLAVLLSRQRARTETLRESADIRATQLVLDHASLLIMVTKCPKYQKTTEQTNLLATAYDVRALDALKQGIGIKSGSDGSVDAFLAKQLVNINVVHTCDDGLWSNSRTIQTFWRKTQTSKQIEA